ncbi:septum site-determining protein MinC [Nitrosomonas cryotolerans]|uniref:Probable septum site-determining protein MinC n=1 Tax=Nitrosomonas cryotolerans ATCC 49181 TaxID=1131553 RepID=A0A1N6F9X5_9PROT|nr:septum site-determining protein MinC [Nitrosomonas cryotolerans]SIN92024.1 septum site-determining protein MinC [Nitrosomonas cryotolerans ATCC 49181]
MTFNSIFKTNVVPIICPVIYTVSLEYMPEFLSAVLVGIIVKYRSIHCKSSRPNGMSKDPQTASYIPPALEFKSGTFFVPILILFSNDLAVIEQHLQEKIRLAPEFFRNSPLIVDVRELNKQGHDLNIIHLTDKLRMMGLFPTGIRGGSEQQNEQANTLFIPIDTMRSNDSAVTFGETQKQATNTSFSQPKAAAAEAAVAVSATVPPITTLITQPIRSGQRVYAAGDLVILSQVSAGAEIMAEGNIHVYNTLRGRALAGVQGNKAARIFCFDLQAELISIAGDYKTSEDLNKIRNKKPVQIYLQDHALIIKEIA